MNKRYHYLKPEDVSTHWKGIWGVLLVKLLTARFFCEQEAEKAKLEDEMQKRRERIEKWRKEKNKGKTEAPVVSSLINMKKAVYKIIYIYATCCIWFVLSSHCFVNLIRPLRR